METRYDMEVELSSLRARRDRLNADLVGVDHRIGEVAGLLVDDGGSRSSVGRIVGVSHTHVSTLIERAAASGPTRDENWLTPTLRGREAARYLETARRSITKIIAGFAPSDVLLESGLHPGVFEQGAPYGLYLPSMLWQLDDGSWLGIDEVSVGYGGTGSTNALRALEDAGVEPRIAREIAGYRFSVTDVVTQTVRGQSTWPRHPSASFDPEGGAYVAKLGASALVDGEPREDTTGFYPSSDGRSSLRQWIDFLAGDCPEWMRGERIARVFLDVDAARGQGFVNSSYRGYGLYPLVIEQGALQLWLPFYPPLDPMQTLGPETYAALEIADLYPRDLAERDARGRFWRYLDTWFHKSERPAFIDVSRDASAQLRSTPALVGGATAAASAVHDDGA